MLLLGRVLGLTFVSWCSRSLLKVLPLLFALSLKLPFKCFLGLLRECFISILTIVLFTLVSATSDTFAGILFGLVLLNRLCESPQLFELRVMHVCAFELSSLFNLHYLLFCQAQTYVLWFEIGVDDLAHAMEII